jgi:hypothetical protein
MHEAGGPMDRPPFVSKLAKRPADFDEACPV